MIDLTKIDMNTHMNTWDVSHVNYSLYRREIKLPISQKVEKTEYGDKLRIQFEDGTNAFSYYICREFRILIDYAIANKEEIRMWISRASIRGNSFAVFAATDDCTKKGLEL